MSVKRGWPSWPVFTGFSLGKAPEASASKGGFSHRLTESWSGATALFVLVGVLPAIMLGPAAGVLADTPKPSVSQASMDQDGMAAVGTAAVEDVMKESDLDNRNAVRTADSSPVSARPLQKRPRSRIEPTVQGAAMEIAIGLPRG